MQETYEAHRQRVIAANLPLSSTVLSGAVFLYALAELLQDPGGVGRIVPPYTAMMIAPWVAMWLVRGPLQIAAERVTLAADVFYTSMLAFMLLQPTTTLSGTALFFTLKMLATALFFPWQARTQYLSAGITLAVYWGAVAVSGHVIDPRASLHQLLGPLIAAVFSVAGARTAELRRRALFERGIELAGAAAQVKHVLESVRDSEARLRHHQAQQQIIFDSVPAMIWYKDRDNRIVRANRPAAETAGLTVEAIEGRSMFDLYPTQAQQFHQDDLEVIRSGEAKRGMVEVLPTASGAKRWVQADKVPYRDDTGAIIGVIVFAVDITEQREAEEALAASTRLLTYEVEVSKALARVGQALISALDTPVILERLCTLTMGTLQCDFSHVLRVHPDTLEHELVSGAGFSAVEWEALRVMRAPDAELAALLRELEREDIVQLDVGALPDSLTKELASQYGVTLSVSAALRRGGEVFGVLTAGFRRTRQPLAAHEERIVRGIAQLASLALENARLVEALERADGIKSEFVATMSHELRTPLNVITGYGSLLVDGEFGDLTEEQVVTMQRMMKSAAELLELINATLDLSRLDAGRVGIDVQEVDLHQMFEELHVEASERAQPAVEMRWNVAADLPALQTDPMKVRVILKNLLANALKFTHEGSVTVHAQVLDGGVEIAVADTGIGISEEVLPVIFEAFRQADSSTTRQYGGVGLGLYIVDRLVTLLQGSVSVESVVAKGTTFRIHLPRVLRQRSAP